MILIIKPPASISLMPLNDLLQYGLQHRHPGVRAFGGGAGRVGHPGVGHRADRRHPAAAGRRLVRRAFVAEHRQI